MSMELNPVSCKFNTYVSSYRALLGLGDVEVGLSKLQDKVKIDSARSPLQAVMKSTSPF